MKKENKALSKHVEATINDTRRVIEEKFISMSDISKNSEMAQFLITALICKNSVYSDMIRILQLAVAGKSNDADIQEFNGLAQFYKEYDKKIDKIIECIRS